MWKYQIVSTYSFEDVISFRFSALFSLFSFFVLPLFSRSNYELPEEGVPSEEVLSLLSDWASKEKDIWSQGKASGAIYHGGDELTSVLTKAYSLFALTNPLHPDLFPYVRKMEAESVRMTCSLFNGDEDSCGIITSGGTESILMAMKAYRDRGAKERGIVNAEIIASITAHAAFEKAAAYFGITLISLPFDPKTGKLRPEDVRAAITSNTVAIVASAPNYPHGVVDPVEELSSIALEHGLGLHVDCCLGSFVIPFARELGYNVPSFDFALPGVTSISADTHKYGFAPKGSSVIMFRTPELRHYMYFVTSTWPGGIYASPAMSGSRPGALVASTWAALMTIGKGGYRQYAKVILAAAEFIRRGIRDEVPGLRVFGDSAASVVAFTNDENHPQGKSLNIFRITTGMSSRGWHLASLQRPSAAHLCVTFANQSHAGEFISDLKEITALCLKDPKIYMGSNVQLYGVANALGGESTKPGQDDSLVGDIARAFIDALTFIPSANSKASQLEEDGEEQKREM